MADSQESPASQLLHRTYWNTWAIQMRIQLIVTIIGEKQTESVFNGIYFC